MEDIFRYSGHLRLRVLLGDNKILRLELPKSELSYERSQFVDKNISKIKFSSNLNEIG